MPPAGRYTARRAGAGAESPATKKPKGTTNNLIRPPLHRARDGTDHRRLRAFKRTNRLLTSAAARARVRARAAPVGTPRHRCLRPASSHVRGEGGASSIAASAGSAFHRRPFAWGRRARFSNTCPTRESLAEVERIRGRRLSGDDAAGRGLRGARSGRRARSPAEPCRMSRSARSRLEVGGFAHARVISRASTLRGRHALLGSGARAADKPRRPTARTGATCQAQRSQNGALGTEPVKKTNARARRLSKTLKAAVKPEDGAVSTAAVGLSRTSSYEQPRGRGEGGAERSPQCPRLATR